MKILYFSHRFPSPNSRFIWNELEHFTQSGEVEYLSIEAIDHAGDKEVKSTVIPFEENKWIRRVRWILWQQDLVCTFRNTRFRKQLSAFLKASKPDVIHCHFAYEGLYVLQNLDVDIPLILHFHGYDASQMLRKKSYVKALKSAFNDPRVHCLYVSNNIREKLKAVGLESSRSEVLYCGIEADKFESVPKQSDNAKFRFVQVSNLIEKKGIEFSIRAFAQFLKHQSDPANFEFSIAGAGPLEANLRTLVNELGVASHVVFHGQISKEQVIALLKSADVFVHHSITSQNGDQEGIPTAIMEAMAMGLPVLTTKHSGIPELVEHGVHGFLSAEKDVDEFAAQMAEVSGWEQNRLTLSREQVEQRFSARVHVKQLDQFYRRLLKTS